jgi:sugar/nucleoside kinase (ribokinase family)
MTEAGVPDQTGEGVDVLVSGYASIDVVYQASAPSRAGATALLRGPVAPPPRCGGCGPGAAMALAHAGCRVGLVTWLGDDAQGEACRRSWAEAGIELGGVVAAAGQATPRSFLFYDPAGGATCYYHPSGSEALRLSPAARRLLAGARALAVAVGPPALTEELLAARRPEQALAWNVKADAHAFPPALRRRLLAEAVVVCLNRDELPFVAEMLPPAERPEGDEAALNAAIQHRGNGVVVVTAGAAGSRVRWPGGAADVPAVPVPVVDPTGAGDAFFGAFLAVWLRGADPPAAAAEAAAAAAEFLRRRAAGEEA